MKTAELRGADLDWAVAKCETPPPCGSFLDEVVVHPDYNNFHPSTDWAQGGPIIDREGIDLYCNVATNPSHPDKPWRGSWRARYCRMGYGTEFSYGATALEAAMRCYVASKLGDDVDIPEIHE